MFKKKIGFHGRERTTLAFQNSLLSLSLFGLLSNEFLGKLETFDNKLSKFYTLDSVTMCVCY